MDRYTSPETSRLLAEAGLGDHASWDMSHRLDLTDVLHELTRPRPEEADARPLVSAWRMYKHEQGNVEMTVMRAGELYWRDFGGPTVCEAAALVLLALLRERRKP